MPNVARPLPLNRRLDHRNIAPASRSFIIDRYRLAPSAPSNRRRACCLAPADTATLPSSTHGGSQPSLTSEQVHIHRRAKAAQSNGRPWDALSLLHLHLPNYPYDTHLISLAVSLEARLGVKSGVGSTASAPLSSALSDPIFTIALFTRLIVARRGLEAQSKPSCAHACSSQALIDQEPVLKRSQSETSVPFAARS